MKKHVVNQARKAFFRNLDLSIACQLKLFDNLVVPILTYGCEIWGFGDLSGIEKVHTDFLKRIFKVEQSTRSVMLYGDLGRVPLSINIKKREAGYWYDIINSDNKLSSILYRLILQDNAHNGHSYEWSQLRIVTVTNGHSYEWLKFVKLFQRQWTYLFLTESIL